MLSNKGKIITVHYMAQLRKAFNKLPEQNTEFQSNRNYNRILKQY